MDKYLCFICLQIWLIAICVDSAPTLEGDSTSTAKPATFHSYYGPPDGGVGRKSYEKCREYAKHVNVSYVLPGFHKKYYRNTCGFKAVNLIVGGVLAKPKEFPHMAAVGYDIGNSAIEYFCGGSLISERFVITAGHCRYHPQFGAAISVRLGDLNLENEEDDAAPEEFKVEEIIDHPLYHSISTYNDIALLKLDREVTFNTYIRPICLPVHRNPPTQKCIATGWGTVDYNKELDDAPRDLRKVTIEFFDFEECSAKFESHKKLRNGIQDDTQVCAGSMDERKDTCPGDSGGPLQIYHEDPEAYCMYMLVGITSFGKVCGIKGTPGIYTRTQHYLDWIEETVWP